MGEFRALLLTDVIDSTRLTEALGEAAIAAHWIAHDRAARDLLRTWRGREIERTDGLLAVFDDAADGASFAVDYHRMLAMLGLPFKARAGLHAGPITFRERSEADVALGARRFEVDGLAISIAARVMTTALGGQTLLTVDAQRMLGASALRVQSHGHWRLKGLQEPVELFEVGDEHAAFTPPPDADKSYRVVREGNAWLPVREIKHSLPAERDLFVGRGEAMQSLARALERGARLVSVLGMGGTGKTRLVTHFARTWLGDFPGGAWFCDLSQARHVDGIVAAVAQGLDVPLGKSDPVVQLGHAISGRGRCLVVLDNFEQVARHAEETVGRWLERAPDAQFVVTTRELLGVAGEHALALPPLASGDAVALFVSRAMSATPGFSPDASDLSAIAELVDVLDGLPLAIELAAARIRVMSPRMVLAHMRDRFRMLGARTGRLDRQATLRAAFDWSWDLLSDAEKAALAQLSVFEGGFTLESATAVIDLSDVADAPWIVDVVQSLVDKSFVRRTESDRFDCLTSVRAYAAEHLATAGRFHRSGPSALVAAEHRHGLFFASLGPKRAIEHSCAEVDNLVAACERAVRANDAQIAGLALAGAWSALKLRGPFKIAVAISEKVRSMGALPPAIATTVTRINASALMLSGRMAEARIQFETALANASATAAGDLPHLLASFAELSMREGFVAEALQHFEEALARHSDATDSAFECGVLTGLGTCHEYLGQLDRAGDYYRQALDVARASGERRWEGGALGNLGQLSANLGESTQAQSFYESAIAVAHELGDRQWEGNVRCNLGLLYQAEGRLDDATHQLDAALASARELGHARLECVVLCNLGIVLEARAQHQSAHQHYLQAVDLARRLGDRRFEGQFLGYLGLSHARLQRFDAAAACMENGAALLRAVSDNVSLGVLLCADVEVAQLSGDPRRAREIFDEVERMTAEAEVEPKSDLGIARARARGLVAAAAPSQSP